MKPTLSEPEKLRTFFSIPSDDCAGVLTDPRIAVRQEALDELALTMWDRGPETERTIDVTNRPSKRKLRRSKATALTANSQTSALPREAFVGTTTAAAPTIPTHRLSLSHSARRPQQVPLGVGDHIDHLIEDALVRGMRRRDRQVLREQRDHVAQPSPRVGSECEVVGVPDVDAPSARRKSTAPRKAGLVHQDRLGNARARATVRRSIDDRELDHRGARAAIGLCEDSYGERTAVCELREPDHARRTIAIDRDVQRARSPGGLRRDLLAMSVEHDGARTALAPGPDPDRIG